MVRDSRILRSMKSSTPRVVGYKLSGVVSLDKQDIDESLVLSFIESLSVEDCLSNSPKVKV
jgi:hypothetical protein